ncbi:hypothetical protein ANANG_G00298670 [Anguilla anguilla]|uniref:Uncharacterized protein n=1 Tax=Anguilla anguilla TaxID=7936 RepID=A0A9D3LJ66_ANGAN|nr:hypothetical protein ANANG_G00298670 [Anguilla anguilla]
MICASLLEEGTRFRGCGPIDYSISLTATAAASTVERERESERARESESASRVKTPPRLHPAPSPRPVTGTSHGSQQSEASPLRVSRGIHMGYP